MQTLKLIKCSNLMIREFEQNALDKLVAMAYEKYMVTAEALFHFLHTVIFFIHGSRVDTVLWCLNYG